MALDKATVKEDPREKLKALRAEFAKKSVDGIAATAAASEARTRMACACWGYLPSLSLRSRDGCRLMMILASSPISTWASSY